MSPNRIQEFAMDWYSWLSKSSLDPSLAYDYAILFADNELDEDDMPYFDHAFLQSMGIAIAKHRLEILKLAHHHRRPLRSSSSPPLPVAKLVAAFNRSKSCLARYIRGLGAARRSSAAAPGAILILPKVSSCAGDQRWRGGPAMLRRKSKLALLKQGRLMITDGGVRVAQLPPPPPSRSHSASPMDRGEGCGGGEDDDEGYWESAVEGMKWDCMFQNLKPT